MWLGLYEKFLVAGLKRQALQPGSRGEGERESPGTRRDPGSHDLRNSTMLLTAPRNGGDAKEYHAVNSSGP
jgi:hypothetical protein